MTRITRINICFRVSFIGDYEASRVHSRHSQGSSAAFVRPRGVRGGVRCGAARGGAERWRGGAEVCAEFPYETPPEWFGYLAVEGESQRLCGVCTFKGPAVEGAVEISYYTFPGFEGRGIGTEMARFLVERARSLPDVTKVIAHTFGAEQCVGAHSAKDRDAFHG